MTLGMRNTWSLQGPASSLNCPAIVLECRAIENQSPIALPWVAGVDGVSSASGLKNISPV